MPKYRISGRLDWSAVVEADTVEQAMSSIEDKGPPQWSEVDDWRALHGVRIDTDEVSWPGEEE